MENTGVMCDVRACKYNVAGCKCDLPQIKVTEKTFGAAQTVEEPHYCQSFEKLN
ncbi:MAG: DUF1540 domain-containing protein [Faecalibacterium sp.]|nr:DUF1540 domain-containing protein [Faecalibacterium sp.]